MVRRGQLLWLTDAAVDSNLATPTITPAGKLVPHKSRVSATERRVPQVPWHTLFRRGRSGLVCLFRPEILPSRIPWPVAGRLKNDAS
jgi:hypothetical protein